MPSNTNVVISKWVCWPWNTKVKFKQTWLQKPTCLFYWRWCLTSQKLFYIVINPACGKKLKGHLVNVGCRCGGFLFGPYQIFSSPFHPLVPHFPFLFPNHWGGMMRTSEGFCFSKVHLKFGFCLPIVISLILIFKWYVMLSTHLKTV